MFTQFSKWFWNPYVWLPKGYGWKDLTSNEEIRFPNWNDLWTYPFGMALIAIVLRYQILNRFIFSPLANFLGLKEVKPKPLEANEHLEGVFKKYKNKAPDHVLIASAKKLDWSKRKIEWWLRLRTASIKVSKHTKFMECAWQFTYYTCIFIYGVVIMVKKPWLYELNHCWYKYPFHHLDSDVWWYYMISLSFYWSMIFTHFTETKRKDFWQMFFHHIITITLITFSWTSNLVRVGTLVLILHDCADIPLQGAKMCIYLGYKALCDAVFALFAITWVVTRDCIFPLWIIRSTLFEATEIIPLFPAYYIFNSLLIILLVLHLYWTYFIFKIIANSVAKGKVEDERSSSEIELSEEEELPSSNKEEGALNGIHKDVNGFCPKHISS